ncbi:MAG: hypothetical protein KKF06_01055, partial [Candidatus Margulisbacteria bacterium]|nr:hypothetical protein [Candidatus Margulisiibacteriota bacterium]
MALAEVLSAGPGVSFWNPVVLAASVATVAAAALSAIKGIHLFRRGKVQLLEQAPALEEIENNEEIEKLIFLVNELKRDKERLIWRNQEMQCQLQAAEEMNAQLRQRASTKFVSASSKRFKVIRKKEGRKPKR